MNKRIFVIISGLFFFGILSCQDKNSPEYWLDKLKEPLYCDKAIEQLKEMWSKAYKEAKEDYPQTKEFRDKIVPALVAAYEQYKNQPRTAKEILQLLVRTRDPRSTSAFISALQNIEGVNIEQARLGADGLANLCRDQKAKEDLPPPPNERDQYWQEGCSAAKSALPHLLQAFNKLKEQRIKRGETIPNTPEEDFLTRSLIATMGIIVLAYPDVPERDQVIDALITAVDTPDTLQDLRINMEAIRMLGFIGDPKSIPALVRGIFMQGRRRPVALQEVAKSAIQLVSDLDQVVTALLKAVKKEDEALMKMLKEDERFDWRILNEQVAMLLGEIGIVRDDVIEYLMSELNHKEPDELDKKPEPEGRPDFPPDVWAANRRGWAARALSKLNYKEAESIIIDRLKIKCKGNYCEPQDHANTISYYIEALFNFMDPQKTTPVFKELVKIQDDAIRLNALLRLAWQGGYELLPVFEELQKEYEKIECDPELPQCLKNEISGAYIPRIIAAKDCSSVDCWLSKLKDPNWRIRQKAVYMLGIMADETNKEKISKALLDMFSDPQDDVVIANIFVFERLNPKGVSEDTLNKIMLVYRENLEKATKKGINRELISLVGRLRYKARKG